MSPCDPKRTRTGFERAARRVGRAGCTMPRDLVRFKPDWYEIVDRLLGITLSCR
jgi:hypothetical protein